MQLSCLGRQGEAFYLGKQLYLIKEGVSYSCVLRRTVGGGGANGISHHIKGDDTLGEGSVYNIPLAD